jgi:broad specificity polyphosphatase/5'/3'-nucleotidase SurE
MRSPGLLAAVKAVSSLGDIMIAAPAQQQTGMGRGIPPPNARTVVEERWMIGGQEAPVYGLPSSPALAVSYGILALAPRRPDLDLGINYGENLGTSVTPQARWGSVAGRRAGVKALAVSPETDPAYHSSWRGCGPTRRRISRLFAQVILNPLHSLHGNRRGRGRIAGCSDRSSADTPWRMTRQSRLLLRDVPTRISAAARRDGAPDYR